MRYQDVLGSVMVGLCCGGFAAGELMAGERPAAAVSNIVLSVARPSGEPLQLQIDYPDSFTNRLDLYISTNLQAGMWQLCDTNLSTLGSNVLTWRDAIAAGTGSRFYCVGNADLDTDCDGLVDAREILIYRTNPVLSDSDGDGVPDGAEVRRGTDPNSGGPSFIILYVDSDAGSDDFDGLSPVLTASHGPKRSLAAVSGESYPHDVIQMSGLTVFNEPALCLGSRDVTLCPLGAIYVQP